MKVQCNELKSTGMQLYKYYKILARNQSGRLILDMLATMRPSTLVECPDRKVMVMYSKLNVIQS